jgi:Cu/Ag efflux pump CusA
MVAHIVHTLSRNNKKDAAGEGVVRAVREAALEVERPIFFSLLIIIAAYIPLFCLRWNAWSGGCLRRWHSRSVTRFSVPCCWL